MNKSPYEKIAPKASKVPLQDASKKKARPGRPPRPNMVATTLKIDATLLARMDVLRDELQIPRSLIIARALKKYLEEREPEEI